MYAFIFNEEKKLLEKEKRRLVTLLNMTTETLKKFIGKARKSIKIKMASNNKTEDIG